MSIFKRDHDDMKFKSFLNIVNVTIDYCGYFNNKGVGGFLLDLFITDLSANGNLMQPCPWRGHLYLKRFKLNLSNVPFFIPSGEYLVHSYMYLKDKKTEIFGANSLTYAEVKYK